MIYSVGFLTTEYSHLSGKRFWHLYIPVQSSRQEQLGFDACEDAVKDDWLQEVL